MAFRAEVRPVSRGPVSTVEEVKGQDAFVALEGEWNDLADAIGAPIFYRHAYLRLWLSSFAPEAAMRVLVGRSASGAFVAALPLIERTSRMYGLGVRELVSPTNEHSGRFDLLTCDPEGAARSFAAYLRASADWDVLRLSDVPEEGAANALVGALAELGMPTGIADGPHSPYVRLPTSVAALRERWSAGLRGSLRRRRRRLAEKGPVTVERVDPRSPDLPKRIQEAFELEASGWKGRAGTAIQQDPRTFAFYTGLSVLAADLGQLSLTFLRCGGRAVAFDLAVVGGGRYLSFKHGYAEDVRACSPGQLLTEELLTRCVEEHLSEFDFMGEDAPCKRDWASDIRVHRFLFAFSTGVRGNLLRTLKFQVTPVIKQVRARWLR